MSGRKTIQVDEAQWRRVQRRARQLQGLQRDVPRLLDDVRARGEALAMLTASEPGIYGRFGYGIATLKLSAEIDTAQVRLTVPEGTDEVVLRRADPREALKVCEEVYARQV
ncbi:hypothetical protein ADL27_42505, partial [Streptomyces sp. NRRL F-6602]